MFSMKYIPVIMVIIASFICFLAESRRHRKNYRYLGHIGANELNANYMNYFYLFNYVAPVLCLAEGFYFSHDTPKYLRMFAVVGLIGSVNLRFWSIHCLGQYWTRRCIFPEGLDRVSIGPYKFLKHPEYLARILETFFWGLFFFAPSVCSVLVIYCIYLYLKITKDEFEQLIDLSVVEEKM